MTGLEFIEKVCINKLVRAGLHLAARKDSEPVCFILCNTKCAHRKVIIKKIYKNQTEDKLRKIKL